MVGESINHVFYQSLFVVFCSLFSVRMLDSAIHRIVVFNPSRIARCLV